MCFDVGAQAEKVRKYDKGYIAKDISQMKEILFSLKAKADFSEYNETAGL